MTPSSPTRSKPVRRLLFIVAMEQEIQPLITRFNLKPVPQLSVVPGAPFVAWVGKAHGVTIHAVWCGQAERFGGVNNVGTQAAAVAAYAAIAAFGAPDLLLSAGTAGGFRALGAAVGDVYLSTKCVYHARRLPTGEGRLEEYGFGHFRSPPLGALAQAIGLKQGIVSTSDSLDASERDLELMRSEGTAVKEMEAAAVAWVAMTLGVPFVALKAVTDIVDGPHATRNEFDINLALASERLQQKVAELIARVAGTPLRDWAHSWGHAEPGEAAATRSLEKAPSSPRRLLEAVEAAAPEEPPWRSAVGVAGMLLGAAMSGVAMALVRRLRT